MGHLTQCLSKLEFNSLEFKPSQALCGQNPPSRVYLLWDWGKNETTKFYEREIRLKFCSHSYTYAQWSILRRVKYTYMPRLKSMLSQPVLTFTLGHPFQKGSLMMQDRFGHALTPNLSLIDTQTHPNTHIYWSLHTLVTTHTSLSSHSSAAQSMNISLIEIRDMFANVAVSHGVKACRAFVSLSVKLLSLWPFPCEIPAVRFRA